METQSAPVAKVKKDFVIDIKGIDIKGQIKESVNGFIKENAPDIIDRVMVGRINEAVKKLTPNFITVGETPAIKIEGHLHKAFPEALFLCQVERQLFISGAAGTGKTFLASQVAKALQLPFSHISCSAGLSEAHLLGRMLFDGSYCSSEFVERYENGGVFLFDEIDAADANTLLILNSGLANGIISVPNRKDKPHAKRHENFVCIAAANTWGNGSFEYHGRNHLDAAFLDRFAMSKVHVHYDTVLEKDVCSEYPELAKILWQMRKNAEENKVRKVISTRAFISGAKQLAAGSDIKSLISRLTLGWSNEEKTKVVPAL